MLQFDFNNMYIKNRYEFSEINRIEYVFVVCQRDESFCGCCEYFLNYTILLQSMIKGTDTWIESFSSLMFIIGIIYLVVSIRLRLMCDAGRR